jgi:hypothetical protein
MYSWLEKMETHQGKMEAMIRTGEKQMWAEIKTGLP